jgi:hypothetical protein
MCVGSDSKQYGGKEIAAVTMSHDKTGRRRSEPEAEVGRDSKDVLLWPFVL